MSTTGQESIDDLLKSAINHQAAGRLVDAESLYRQVLRAQPDHAPAAAHLVGLLGQTGRHEEAISLAEAITQIPAPTADLKGKIVDVVEKGYKLGDKIIRFPKVVIGN